MIKVHLSRREKNIIRNVFISDNNESCDCLRTADSSLFPFLLYPIVQELTLIRQSLLLEDGLHAKA